jgi:hypothetical protein
MLIDSNAIMEVEMNKKSVIMIARNVLLIAIVYIGLYWIMNNIVVKYLNDWMMSGDPWVGDSRIISLFFVFVCIIKITMLVPKKPTFRKTRYAYYAIFLVINGLLFGSYWIEHLKFELWIYLTSMFLFILGELFIEFIMDTST